MPRNPNKVDYSGGFPLSLHAFNLLEDPRSTGKTQHHFGEVIFMVFTCILCGISKYDIIEEFCEIYETWFKKWVTLPNGIPLYNTFSRIFEAVAPDRFADCILSHLSSIGI